jgi:type I restriction-modification system DNA methylase subunit
MPKVSQKHKDLGIFYTPQEVVEFIYDILLILKKNQGKRWLNEKGKPKYPSVLDPAVGEGVFLKTALEKKFTRPDFVWGADIDENVKKDWERINLLKSFGSTAKLEKHFFVQNGLSELPKIKFRWKRGGLKEFDLLVGNPPYGGLGIEDFDKPINKGLEEFLKTYDIWQINGKKTKNGGQNSLFSKDINHSLRKLTKDEKRKLERFPIEVLFLERFIQLTKPGGWIAIIIPDGILANSQLDYVRKFIASNTKIEAIVSLPRGAFKQAGTNAKTSILFLTKYPSDVILSGAKNLDYPVFLASVDKINSEIFNKIVKYYQEFIMNQTLSKNQKVFNDEKLGIMTRADKTLKDLLDEKPDSRFDVNYWHPKYTELEQYLINNFECNNLENIKEFLTLGHVGKMQYIENGEVSVIGVKDILKTGINPYSCKKIKKDGPIDLLKRRVKMGDILFIRSGVGSVGRTIIINNLYDLILSISGDVYLLRTSKINCYYLAVFLNSRFGFMQIERIGSGVSGQIHLNFPEFGRIVVPFIEKTIQNNIQKEYLGLVKVHDKAMGAKGNSDEAGYKKNIATAEKMLKDLIKKTEAVIEGKRKDVI